MLSNWWSLSHADAGIWWIPMPNTSLRESLIRSLPARSGSRRKVRSSRLARPECLRRGRKQSESTSWGFVVSESLRRQLLLWMTLRRPVGSELPAMAIPSRFLSVTGSDSRCQLSHAAFAGTGLCLSTCFFCGLHRRFPSSQLSADQVSGHKDSC